MRILKRVISGVWETLYPYFIFCDIFEIELIEMGKPTILATDSEMPAPYREIMRAGHLTMTACGSLKKFPEIVASDLRERPRLCYIFDSRDENPGCPTVIARHFSLVRDGCYNLVGNLPAMIAISTVFCEDEPVAHER
jgi:hypothetical protein